MAQTFSQSIEYRNLAESWYNKRERAIEDLLALKIDSFHDTSGFALEVVRLQEQIRLYGLIKAEVDEYFTLENSATPTK